MSSVQQDKPYKSIDLSFSATFAVIFALRDRGAVLVKQLSLDGLSPDAVEESEAQLRNVRAVLAQL